MNKPFVKGDRVRSVFKWDNIYVVLANNNGWLTVQCAEPMNHDLIFPRCRASSFTLVDAD